MANEIAHNATTGQTLYFCIFQLDGDVFLSNGESDEVWGTGGRDANDYDMAMSENAPDGHYVGSFDTSIASGIYMVAVYIQAGANPVDSDLADAQGQIDWGGSSEITLSTLSSQGSQVLNVYNET